MNDFECEVLINPRTVVDWTTVTGLSIQWIPEYLHNHDHQFSADDAPGCMACWGTDGCDLLEGHPGDHLSLELAGVHARRRPDNGDVFFVRRKEWNAGHE